MRGSGMSFNSLRVKLTAAILVFSVLLVSLQWVLHLSAAKVVREQVAKSNQKLLSLHMRGSMRIWRNWTVTCMTCP